MPLLEERAVMIARIMRSAEAKERFADTELRPLLDQVPESDAAVVVVEDEHGKIVARWCVFQVTHFEGLWIDPEYRGNVGVIRPLLRQAYAMAQVRGERYGYSGAEIRDDGEDQKVAGLLQRLGGVPLAIKFYKIPVASQVEH